MLGVKLASFYSHPPCDLGFCGSKVKNASKILMDYLYGKKIFLNKVKQVLKNFEASYPYYELIARVNNIKDPLDYRVVEAYWIGNNLLDKVKYSDLKKMILNDFTKPYLLSKKQAQKKALLIPLKAKPHHSFHVLILGSITGKVIFKDNLYDLCRIGWGKIIEINNSKLKVKARPLISKNNKFLLGKYKYNEIEFNKKLFPKIKIGNTITFHWNKACQIINKKQEENLFKYTLLNIKAVNEQHR